MSMVTTYLPLTYDKRKHEPRLIYMYYTRG